jgi:lysine 2,3-aminomutase
LSPTCPVLCGHCTRMNLVGPSTPAISKLRFHVSLEQRMSLALSYLAETPSVRDVVVSGGDVSMVPPHLLAKFVENLVRIKSVRSIRLATKALISLPQFFLRDDVRRALERMARSADDANVELAVHTHCNAATAVTPLVADAAASLRAAGIHTLRNQGVLMRGVNDSTQAILDLCFRLLDGPRITPYYFYMMDMIPHAEHWRTTLGTAQRIMDEVTGYLPGFGTPRIVCDVPGVGKRLVHQACSYDRERGISLWNKSYLTPLDDPARSITDTMWPYFDPVFSLGPEGQEYWQRRREQSCKVGPRCSHSPAAAMTSKTPDQE